MDWPYAWTDDDVSSQRCAHSPVLPGGSKSSAGLQQTDRKAFVYLGAEYLVRFRHITYLEAYVYADGGSGHISSTGSTIFRDPVW